MRAEVLNEVRATVKKRCRRITTEEAKRRGQQQVENDRVALWMNQAFSLPLAARRRIVTRTKGWEAGRSRPQVRVHSSEDLLNCRWRLRVLGERLVHSSRFGSKTWNSEFGSGEEEMRGWQSW